MNNAREKLIIPTALVVAVGWLGALASGIFTADYVPFEIATPVMILLAGYVFGVQIVRSVPNGNGGDKNGH